MLLCYYIGERRGIMEELMPFIWIVFAVIMAVCEAATTQLVSIWFVIGAVAAAITTIFTPSIFIQVVVFLAFTAASLIITRPLAKKLLKKTKNVSTNADRLIGQTGVVIADILSNHDVGQVKINGEIWSARSDFAPVTKNSKVKVLSIDGVKLIVEPVKEEK